MIKTLPCVICKRELSSVFNHEDTMNQPNDATNFCSNGNYGSGIFDPIDQYVSLEINICDFCLEDALATNRVYYVVKKPQPIQYEYIEGSVFYEENLKS